MRGLDWRSLSADYAQYHRDPRNRLCHAVGVPLILLCVVRWTLWPGTPWPVVAAVLPLYMAWDAPAALAMAAVVAGLAWLARSLAWQAFPALFTAGWALQLLGHRFEGRSPAFTRNLLHLLVGPLWILRETVLRKT